MFKIILLVILVETVFGEANAQAGRFIPQSPNSRAKYSNRNDPPQKVDYMKYRFDADSGKYVRLGTTDKCPGNMRFFAVLKNETAGMCDCDYYQCSRPSIYSPKTKECYFAWTQGPCAEGEWFTFDKDLKPVCERRACAQGADEGVITADTVSLSYWFKNPVDGECYESGSQGYCKEEDETLLISPGEPYPKCRSTSLCVPLGRPEPQLCFPGNRMTYLGLCDAH